MIGIITFMIAILASGYARFVTLHNGQVELQTIIQTLKSESPALPIEAQPEDVDSSTIRRRGYIMDLLFNELRIMVLCAAVDPTSLLPIFERLGHLGAMTAQELGLTSDLLNQLRTTLFSGYADDRTARKSASWLSKTFSSLSALLEIDRHPGLFALIWYGLLGPNKVLMRRYKVRIEVLELVRQREVLRSQLMFHQTYMKITLSKEQNAAIASLDLKNQKLMSGMGEVAHFLLEMEESIKRLECDHLDIKPLLANKPLIGNRNLR